MVDQTKKLAFLSHYFCPHSTFDTVSIGVQDWFPSEVNMEAKIWLQTDHLAGDPKKFLQG